VVKDKAIIAAAGNRVVTNYDATAHAEIEVIRKACQALQTHRLDGCDLYVTLEPCAMCAQALAHARVRRIYFGAYDVKGGGVLHGSRVFDQPTCHHRPEVIGGILEHDCQQLLVDFFQEKR
jgi:tRNA(adenine34) deaminase